jgi:SAM-dependent methyltransferase
VKTNININSWDSIWGREQKGGLWHESDHFLQDALSQFSSTEYLHSPLLDVGCGRGNLLSYLQRMYGVSGYGCDFSLPPLQSCSSSCVQTDCRLLPFASATFSTLSSLLLIEHVPQYDRFFHEAARVLRHEGHLYILFPNKYSLVAPALFLRRTILRKRQISYHYPLGAKEVIKKLHHAGFKIVSVDYMSIGSYRKGLEKLASSLVACLLPRQFREEILIICQKTNKPVGRGSG